MILAFADWIWDIGLDLAQKKNWLLRRVGVGLVVVGHRLSLGEDQP